MKALVNTLPCLVALLVASSGALPARQPPAKEPVFDYTNPLDFSYQYFDGKTSQTKKELRDPCIIREGDTCYLVFTMYPFRGREERHLEDVDMGSSPGIQMFSTKDFKTWKTGNWLVK